MRDYNLQEKQIDPIAANEAYERRYYSILASYPGGNSWRPLRQEFGRLSDKYSYLAHRIRVICGLAAISLTFNAALAVMVIMLFTRL